MILPYHIGTVELRATRWMAYDPGFLTRSVVAFGDEGWFELPQFRAEGGGPIINGRWMRRWVPEWPGDAVAMKEAA